MALGGGRFGDADSFIGYTAQNGSTTLTASSSSTAPSDVSAPLRGDAIRP